MKQKKRNAIFVGAVSGLLSVSLAFGALPSHKSNVVIYQNLSDIRVTRQKELSFDNDIAYLSRLENKKRFSEDLPLIKVRHKHKRLSAPLSRVSKMKYSYNSNKTKPNN